jgi:hypothetical protein
MVMTLNEAREKMSAIRASLKSETDAIRRNGKYTEAGRRQELAMSLINHRRQAESLKKTLTVDNESTRTALAGKLFGIPAGSDAAAVLSFRDANDRADRITNAGDASKMLKRALEQNDLLLARAVAGHAHSKKWSDVTESYAEATGLTDQLDEFDALPTGGMLKVVVAALFLLPAPVELNTTLGAPSDAHLHRIADGAVDA